MLQVKEPALYVIGIVTIIAAILLLAFGIRVIFSSVLRRNPASLALLVSAVLWLVAMGATHLLPSVPARLSALYLQFCSLAWLVPFLLSLTMGFVEIRPRIHGAVFAFLCLISAGFTWLILGSASSGLVFRDLEFDMVSGGVSRGNGPFYLPFALYAAVATLVSVTLLLARSRGMLSEERTRAKILVGTFIPAAGMATAEALGFRPIDGQSLIPFGLALSALVLGWGIIRARVLSPVDLVKGNLVETMTDPILVTKDDERVLYANSMARTLATAAHNHKPLRLSLNFPFIRQPAAFAKSGEECMVKAKGIDWLVKSSFATSARGHGAAVLTVLRDVTRMTSENNQLEGLVRERTRLLEESKQQLEKEIALYQVAQEQQAKLVKEKEMLLKELHHRVKNNLQIIISLINLQSNRIKEGVDVKLLLSAMTDRVRSISMVHERMYRLPFYDGLDFGDYIAEIITGVSALYDPGRTKPVLDIPRNRFRASVDFCIDFGLVINELTTNAFRHAILSGGGPLEVSLSASGRHARLVMRDHGPGMPGIDDAKSKSLGLNIIRSILGKYDTALETGLDGGAWVGTTIPLSAGGLSLIKNNGDDSNGDRDTGS